MGFSASPEELARKFGRLAADYADLPTSLVGEGSKIVKQAVEAVAPSRLRGVGKSGAKLSARINVIGQGEDSQALVFAVGPWQLIERDTRAHLIVPKGARGLGASRRSRHSNARGLLGVAPTLRGLNAGFGKGAVLRLGDGEFFAYVHHPGTRGKHPWAKGVAIAEPAVARLFEASGELVLRRIFL